MQTVQTTAVIGSDHTVTITVPPDITPGPCHVTIVVNDGEIPIHRATGQPLIFSSYAVEPPSDTTFRREEMYGDDGR